MHSYFRFLGSGPFWDYGTSASATTRVCRDESWWEVVIPTANFKSPTAHCNSVGWYLANDMQFTLIVPFIIILYLRRPILAHFTVAITCVAVMANHIRYYMSSEADQRGVFESSMMLLSRVTDDEAIGYVSPQYRCSAFLIGMAAGQLLNQYGLSKVRRWPGAFVMYGKVFLLIISYLIAFMPYIISLVPLDNENFVRLLAATLNGTLHSITSTAAAIFVLLLCTGHFPLAGRFLSLKFFSPPANAALSTLLVHIPLIYYHTLTFRRLPELSGYFMFQYMTLWCIEAFLLAALVHVLFELPLRRFLIKLMINLIAGEENQTKSGGKAKAK